jgi:hypothetical protein
MHAFLGLVTASDDWVYIKRCDFFLYLRCAVFHVSSLDLDVWSERPALGSDFIRASRFGPCLLSSQDNGPTIPNPNLVGLCSSIQTSKRQSPLRKASMQFAAAS